VSGILVKKTMKHALVFYLMLVCFSACKKEATQPTMLNEVFDSSQASLLAQGTFVANVHPTSGTVKVYLRDGSKYLVFSGFKTDSGPDLRIYLSRSTNTTDFVDLGALKSTNGNFFYNLGSTINTTDYNHALIWCEDFSVLFGHAQLQ
jgi:hypothetical protein